MTKFNNLIDTTSVYKFKSSFVVDRHGKYSYRYLVMNGGYIRFYNNGKLSCFAGTEQKNIKRNTFNPKAGNMGGYYFKDNKLYLKSYFIFEGHGVIKKELVILKNDTLYSYDEDSKYKGSLYVRDTTIPKEYLKNWKPDW